MRREVVHDKLDLKRGHHKPPMGTTQVRVRPIGDVVRYFVIDRVSRLFGRRSDPLIAEKR